MSVNRMLRKQVRYFVLIAAIISVLLYIVLLSKLFDDEWAQNTDNFDGPYKQYARKPRPFIKPFPEDVVLRSYRIQVYDTDGRLMTRPYTRKMAVELQSSKNRQQYCGNGSTIEITVGDERNRFHGMDAIVFNIGNQIVPELVPPLPIANQQAWIMFSHECPLKVSSAHVNLKDFPVHATWTYHRSSELSAVYGYYKPGVPRSRSRKPAIQWVRGKTKLVAWVASNCNGTSWPRTNFVRELEKYVDVDSYGACGKIDCPHNEENCTDGEILRQYKFYLALENSECRDYLTEKVWAKTLRYGVVPIVYGPSRQDYEEVLPPNSFIYIGDFKTVSQLADYLKLLDTNHELYARYFEWYYAGSLGSVEVRTARSLCRVIPIIESLWRGDLKQQKLKDTKYYKSCRKGSKILRDALPKGLGNWAPW